MLCIMVVSVILYTMCQTYHNVDEIRRVNVLERELFTVVIEIESINKHNIPRILDK